jgi:hypothetical protein
LTVAEQQIVSRCILFHLSVKFASDVSTNGVVSFKGHVIAFAHSGANIMSSVNRLPRTDICKTLSVAFVGTNDHWMQFTGSASARSKFLQSHSSLTVRVDVVYKFLLMKKFCDPSYADIEIDDSDSVKQLLSSVSNNLLDSALLASDDVAIRLDTSATANHAALPVDTVGDGAAGDGVADAPRTVDLTDFGLEPVFVAPAVHQHVPTGIDVLHAAKRACTSPADGAAAPPVPVQVHDTPVNEFSNNYDLFVGGFPHLFLLGQGISLTAGSLTARDVEHLLFQYDGRFAKCPSLLFALFNQQQRHQAAQQVSLRVKSNHHSFTEFIRITNDDAFREKLERCIADPTSAEAKALAAKITDIVRLTGSEVPWSPAERQSALSRIVSLMYYCGPPAFFVTLAPSDMDSYLTFRIAHTRTNTSWDINTPLLGVKERMKSLTENPFAAACVYDRLINAVFTHMFGMSPQHIMRTSQPPVDARRMGIFGLPVAFAGVTEVQARQSAHGHFLVWVDLSPVIIQQFLNSPESLSLLSDRINSVVVAYLDENAEEDSKLMSVDLPCSEETPLFRDGRLQSPLPDTHPVEFQQRVNNITFATNRHSHGPSCMKGPTGKFRCRFGLPTPLCNRDNCFVELVDEVVDSTGAHKSRALKKISERQPADQDLSLLWNDRRVIVLELYRPSDSTETNPSHEGNDKYWVDVAMGPNGRVVTFSPSLSAALACNTNVEPLGNFAQAKSALFYLLKYIVKDGSELANTLSLLHAADKHNQLYPSIADNTGTNVRNTQYLTTRLLNSISGQVEVGGQVASLSLCGVPSNLYSHDFAFLHIHPAIVYVKSRHALDPPSSVARDSVDDLEWIRDFFDKTSDDSLLQDHLDDIALNADERQFDLDNNEDGGLLHVAHDGQSVRLISQHTTYLARPECMSDVSFYEMCGIFCVRRMSKGRDENQPALAARRPPNATFPLDKSHPQAKTHVLAIRSKQCVPLPAGCSPPRHPGPYRSDAGWLQRADRWAAYIITMFVPWDLKTGAPPIPLTHAALTRWLLVLRDSNRFIDKAVLFWVRNFAQGISVSAQTMRIISNYRNRGAHHWNNNEQRAFSESRGPPDGAEVESLADSILRELLHRYGSILDGRPSVDDRTSELLRFLSVLDSSIHSTTLTPELTPLFVGSQNSARLDQVNVGDIARMCELLRQPNTNEPMEIDDFVRDDHGGGVAATALLPGQQFDNSPAAGLNEQQNEAFICVVNWVNADSAYRHDNRHHPAPGGLFINIDGAAGTGKSHFVHTLVQRLGGDKYSLVRSCAPTALAACNLPGGMTVHSLIAMTITSTLSHTGDTVSRAKKRFANARVVIIDEISMLNAVHLERIDERCREFCDRQLPFGGLAVVCMGDFFQIPPVGSSLLSGLFQNTPAGRLFQLFRTIRFTQQMRAVGDPQWSKVIGLFRDPSASLTPIKDSNMLSRVGLLTRADVAADPLWSSAVIVTSANIARFAMNKAQIFRAAKRAGVPVIGFPLELDSTTRAAFEWSSRRTGVSLEHIVDMYSAELVFYFVAGAPALLSGFNMCTEKELTNNTRCTLHSLTFNPSSSVEAIWLKINNTAAGQLVMVDPPLSVNVRIDDSSSRSVANWPASETLVPGQIVIPLMQQREPRTLKMLKPARSVSKSHSDSTRKSKSVYRYFSYGLELGYAVTANKVQGQTLARVIVDYNDHGRARQTTSSVYVSSSRVRSSTHIRMLPLSLVCRTRLEHLQSDETLVRWFYCVRDNLPFVMPPVTSTASKKRKAPTSSSLSALSARAFQSSLSAGGRTSLAAAPSRPPVYRVFNRPDVVVHDVAADGNCFFRVLAKYGAGGRVDSPDTDHLALRAAISSHALTYRETLKDCFFPDVPVTYDEYVASMSVNKQSSDNFEIAVASHYLRRAIIVYYENTPSHTVLWPDRVDGGAPISVLFRPPGNRISGTEIGHYLFVHDGQQL